MEERLVHVSTPKEKVATLRKLARREGVELLTVSALDNGRRTLTLIVKAKARQELLDDIQKALGSSGGWRLVVLPLEATVPQFKVSDDEKVVEKNATATREELTERIAEGAVLNRTTAALTLLSAIVAAVGLTQDSIAVIIGAMVIAPLLGPILAMILGTSLGELGIIKRSVLSAAAGLALAVAVGAAFGFSVPFDPTVPSIAERTQVGAASVALALASGAAAALSVMTGISGILVGVMVAAALLPPAVAAGLLVGKAAFFAASGAALLLGVNIAALTLAGQLVFLVQGIRPRTLYRLRTAHQSVAVSLLFWTAALIVLGGLVLLRSSFTQ